MAVVVKTITIQENMVHFLLMLSYHSLLLLFVLLRSKAGSAFTSTKRKGCINSSLTPLDSLDANSNDVETTNIGTNNSNNTVKHKRMRIPILSYRDNYVIVSKRAGLTMQRNSNRWGHAGKAPALETLVRKQLGRKPYIVHRLDHRTSGAVIMGFDSSTTGKLHGRLRDEGAVKLYVALVRGDLRAMFQSDGVCAAGERLDDILPKSEAKEESQSTRRESYGKITIDLPIKVGDVEKESRTDFYFLSSVDLNERSSSEETNSPFLNKSLTLLLCRPRTGRMHQIRRHVQRGLNSPIIGDSQHGDSRINRFWRETIGLDRLALHCWYINLPPLNHNDEDGGAINCIAPLPGDFIDALRHEDLNELWSECLQVVPQLGMEPYDEKGCTYGRYYRSKNNTA